MPKILLASPGGPHIDALRAQLLEWSYPVHFVTEGREAMLLLRGDDGPRIAFVDANQGDLTGIEVAALAKEKAQRFPPWIVLLCDRSDADTVARAMEAGVDDLLLKPVDGADLKVRLAVAERIQSLMTQLDAQMNAVRFHATHDSLTGLWNRESLLGMLFPETDRVQRMKTPLALLLMDLDHFSSVNLDYGYDAGDRVLQELGNRFRRHLRSYDLIGRYGEDEFVIALPGCDMKQAFILANGMNETVLGKPFPLGPDTVRLTASIGIGQSYGRSPLVVLREAERALAEAKMGGRNRVIDYQGGAPAGFGESPLLKLE